MDCAKATELWRHGGHCENIVNEDVTHGAQDGDIRNPCLTWITRKWGNRVHGWAGWQFVCVTDTAADQAPPHVTSLGTRMSHSFSCP